MTTTATPNTTETLPSNLNQVRAIAARVFEDAAANECTIQTTFGEVRAVRPATPGDDAEIFMAPLAHRDFCKFLNGIGR
jgi:hypothetical protein